MGSYGNICISIRRSMLQLLCRAHRSILEVAWIRRSSFLHPLIHWSIDAFIHSFIHSFLPSFLPSFLSFFPSFFLSFFLFFCLFLSFHFISFLFCSFHFIVVNSLVHHTSFVIPFPSPSTHSSEPSATQNSLLSHYNPWLPTMVQDYASIFHIIYIYTYIYK